MCIRDSGRTGLGGDLLRPEGPEQQSRQQHGDRDDHGQGGRQPSEPSRIEPAEPDAAVGGLLTLQQTLSLIHI